MTLSILNGPGNSQAALQESDTDAFKRLLRSMVRTGVDVDGMIHDGVTADSTDPLYGTVVVSIAPSRASIDYWGYQDNIELKYRRIPFEAIADRYGSVLRTDLPTDSRALMKAYFSRNGLYDRSEQIRPQAVNANGQVTMEAEPGQFLVHGSAVFEIKPLQRQLSTVLPNLTVSGFREPNDFDSNIKAELLTQLTALNAETLPYPLQVEFSTLTTPELINGRQYDNTSVVLSAHGEGFYLGSATVIYSRLDFGWYTSGEQIYMEGPSVPDVDFMLNEVGSQTGFPVDRSDVLVESYPPVPQGDLVTLTIFFKPDNLRYTGELTIDYRAV